MSTFTDGAPPSVTPGPEHAPGTDTGEQAPSAQRRGTERPPDAVDDPGWVQEEIRRRMAAKAAEGSGARHARRGAAAPSNAAVGYAPRHATAPAPPSPMRRAVVGPAPVPLAPETRPVPVSPPEGPPPRTPQPSPRGPSARPPTGPPPGPSTGPPPVPPAPAPDGQPTGPTTIGALRRVDPPAEPGVPLGPGLPTISASGTRPAGRGPVPPAGPAAARLLSPPPPSPPSTPTGIPIDGGPTAATGPIVPVQPRVRPRPTASAELEASGRVLWTSITPPGAPVAPPPGGRVALPTQRDAGPDSPTAGFAATPVRQPGVDRSAGLPERYADYDDYDDEPDDYDDEPDDQYDDWDETDAEGIVMTRVETGPGAGTDVDGDAEPGAGSVSAEETAKRVRVVLAERTAVARPVRTVVDVQEGTGVGEVLRRGLIRSQLMVALSFAAGAMLTLGLLPLVFAFLPEISRFSVLGIRLPWLLLGGLVYPFLLGLGWWHTRTAERVEQGFADHVQD